MRIPLPPEYRPKQRFAGRFWNTRHMMEVLSIYHGATAEAYPKTWQYRTLIAVHRAQNSINAYRKGYGADWKNLKKVVVDGVTRSEPEKGLSIKGDLLEYKKEGRLPLQALQLAAAEIRAFESALWLKKRLAG